MLVWYAAVLPKMTRLPVNHDELNFLFEALRLPLQHRLTGYIHASLLFEIIAACESILYLILRSTHQVGSSFDFLVHVLKNAGAHLFFFRAIVAIAGVLTVVQVARVGRLFGGRAAGTIAALFCATNYTYFAMTALCKEDVLSWLLTLVAMEFAWRTSESLRPRDAVLCGIAIGVATAAKFLAVFCGALVLFPLLRHPENRKRDAVKSGVIIAAVAASSFFVLFPFVLTDTATVISSLNRVSTINASLGTRLTLPIYVFAHMPHITGLFVLFAAVIEGVRRLMRERRGPIYFVVPPVLQLIFMGTKRGYSMPHYVFPLALLCFMLAAALMVEGARRLVGSSRSSAAAGLVAIAIIGIDAVYLRSSIKYAFVLTAPDNRLIAKEAFLKMAAPGDCVVMGQMTGGENAVGPPLVSESVEQTQGPFGRALAVVASQSGEPRFRLRYVYGKDVDADRARGCRWIITGRAASHSSAIEEGIEGPKEVADPQVPPDFRLVQKFDAFPEQHSVWYPYPTSLDYKELASVPFASVLRDRRLGMTLFVYRNSGQ